VAQPEPIHLLILVASTHDAEVLASSLRDSGHPVRHTHIDSIESLLEHLDKQQWDLLISAPKVGNYTA